VNAVGHRGEVWELDARVRQTWRNLAAMHAVVQAPAPSAVTRTEGPPARPASPVGPGFEERQRQCQENAFLRAQSGQSRRDLESTQGQASTATMNPNEIRACRHRIVFGHGG
jgi:hypothetical protein